MAKVRSTAPFAVVPGTLCVKLHGKLLQAQQVFEANHLKAPEVGDILIAPASAAPFAHVYTVSSIVGKKVRQWEQQEAISAEPMKL